MKNKITKKINLKKKIIDKIKNIFNNNFISLIFINNSNLKSNSITYIRKISNKNNINVCMIKNSLLKKFIINTNFNILKNKIKGSNLIIYFYDTNKIIYILKELDNLFNKNFVEKIKLIFIENKIFENDEINYLFNLSSYNDSIKKFLFIINKAILLNFLKIIYKLKENKYK